MGRDRVRGRSARDEERDRDREEREMERARERERERNRESGDVRGGDAGAKPVSAAAAKYMAKVLKTREEEEKTRPDFEMRQELVPSGNGVAGGRGGGRGGHSRTEDPRATHFSTRA